MQKHLKGDLVYMKKSNDKLEILYDDQDIIIINKAPGMLSIPDRFNIELPNLRDILTEKFGSIFVCHRLDKETSGIIVFAKNAVAHKFINEQFSAYENTKIYHAIVAGSFLRDELLIDIPVMQNPNGRHGGMIPSARGKEAYTQVKVLERYKNATLLECQLLTGRQHQIRTHLKAIGYPLLVDSMYGNAEAFYLSNIKKRYNLPKGTDETPILSRVSLHAFSLEMAHPNGKETIKVQADYPKDFSITVKQLGKFAPMPKYFALSNELLDEQLMPE